MTERSQPPGTRRTAPSVKKGPTVARHRKSRSAPVSKSRKITSWIFTVFVAIAFTYTVQLIVEARHADFYGEPLLKKMSDVMFVRLNGMPEDPDARVRVVTGIPQALYLPPEAVLPEAPAARLRRIGLGFAYLQEDVVLGKKQFRCRASNLAVIPLTALNVAMALERFSEESLKKLKLEYIVFCGDLYAKNIRVGGFPAPPNNLMFLNLTRRETDSKIQDLFFHEFYHLFEDRYRLVRDPVWVQYFNFGYYNSYKGIIRPSNNEIGTGGEGFLNNYSRSFPHEDRAEIFSALMVSQDMLISYIIRTNDEALAAKAEYISRKAVNHLGVDFGDLWK